MDRSPSPTDTIRLYGMQPVPTDHGQPFPFVGSESVEAGLSTLHTISRAARPDRHNFARTMYTDSRYTRSPCVTRRRLLAVNRSADFQEPVTSMKDRRALCKSEFRGRSSLISSCPVTNVANQGCVCERKVVILRSKPWWSKPQGGWGSRRSYIVG